MVYCRQVLATRRPKVTCAVEAGLCIAGRFGSSAAVILSATAATWFPQAALAASKVKIAGTAKVNITNIPSVNLNGTPIVRLDSGSTVAVQPGSAVSLQPGTTVGLEPGAAVSLQPGSTVGLQPGSTVSLPVGTKVGLDAGTTVKLDPTSTISVKDEAARQAVQKAFTLSMNTNDNNDAEAFAVPPDKVLVVEYLSCSLRVSSGETVRLLRRRHLIGSGILS
jgi:dUTPase